MNLAASDILGKDDLPRKSVEVPEWGGTVWVRGLTGSEWAAYQSELIDRKTSGKNTVLLPKLENTAAKLCVKGIVDEHGNRLFKDSDASALGEKSAAVLERLAKEILALSGQGEDLGKDSQPTTGEGSSID